MGLKVCVFVIWMYCFCLLLNWVLKWVFFVVKKFYGIFDFIFFLLWDLLCKNFFLEIEGFLKID